MAGTSTEHIPQTPILNIFTEATSIEELRIIADIIKNDVEISDIVKLGQLRSIEHRIIYLNKEGKEHDYPTEEIMN
jgi:hypothetical protein